MSCSLDDLIALVRQRGTTEAFPERDELHGLLDPFRALADQESVRLALAAAVRKGDRLVARVGAEALAYLGGEAAVGLLVGLAMDDALGTSQRAAAVWAIDRHLPDVRGRLAPQEQAVFMSLPVFEILEDPEADHGFGLQALLGSYAGFSPSVRATFLAAIGQAARERGLRLAGLCVHLLVAEPDPERRLQLLDLAAGDGTQESADLLAIFAARATDPQEAKHARRHLHQLRAKGMRGSVRADLQGARILLTGVDGDACFAANVIIPRVPAFDFANLLFHVETGLRDGFVMRNLPRRDVDELVAKIQRECGTFSAFVPLPLAARMIDEVKGGSRAATLGNADAAKAMALAEPVLAEGRRQPYVEPAAAAAAEATTEEVKGLLDSPGFESWFFETGEAAVKHAVAPLLKPVANPGKDKAQALAERMESATLALIERLRADGEHLRLQRMLRHQARLLECSADARASLCRRLAVEVGQPASRFLGVMATRAVREALEGPPDDRAPRFLEARQQLRAFIGRPDEGHRKLVVANLDVAAVARVALIVHNREAPSSRREPLAALDGVALGAGRVFVDGIRRGDSAATIQAKIEEALAGAALFVPDQRRRAAALVVAEMAGFTAEICSERCPHRCFDDPDGDGRAAFYADGLPWDSGSVGTGVPHSKA